MKCAWLTAAALAALCLAPAGGPAVADDDAGYTVVVKKVEVKTTQKDGSAWDVDNGKPDLAVIVRNVSDKGSKEFTTKTKDDTLTAEFDEPASIKVRPGQTLEFEVVDKDVAVNDTIGKVKKEMTADHLKSGKIRLEKFDQVVYLEIEVKKL